MQRYNAVVMESSLQNVLANLYANGALPKIYYLQVGIAGNVYGVPAFGVRFAYYRTPDSGTSGATNPGKLLAAGSDSLSDSITQIKSAFSINPTLTVKLFDLPMFFRGMVEWTAKRGKEIRLATTEGFAVQCFTTGMILGETLSICYQFEE